jgi:hypothetical protein
MRLVVDQASVEQPDPLVDPVPEHEASVHERHLGLFDRQEGSVQEDDAGHGNSKVVTQLNQA